MNQLKIQGIPNKKENIVAKPTISRQRLILGYFQSKQVVNVQFKLP
jgi:hypothetical protein